jgi:hypothetical protein
VLSVDIRKLPSSSEARRNRQTATRNGTASQSGSASSVVSAGEDTSGATTIVGSVDFLSQEPPSASGRRARKPKPDWTKVGGAGARYWSEYDHPEELGEDDDENGYYIYVNPDEPEESVIELVKDTFRTFRRLFIKDKEKRAEATEHDALLGGRAAGVLPKIPFSEDDLNSSSSSEDEDEAHAAIRSQYGTFLRHEFQSHEGSDEYDVITMTLFSAISLFFSTTISIVLLVLSAVGKHKAREEVDIVVSLGVFVSLAFALAGFWGLARQGAGWARWIAAAFIFGGVVVIDGILMAKLVGELKGSVP